MSPLAWWFVFAYLAGPFVGLAWCAALMFLACRWGDALREEDGE